MSNEKVVLYDLEGKEVVKVAILELLNQCPLLENESDISFSVLEEKHGFAMIPASNSIIETSKKSITGITTEICYYPFTLVYRDTGMSEKKKFQVSELLDNIGKWMERKEIAVDGETYKLSAYPALTGNRKFLEIKRQTNSYLAYMYEGKSEDWEIRITARYQNEYKG